MNTDIRLQTSWLHHPKRQKLQRRLGPDGVVGFIDLLLSVSQSKPSGRLDGWDREDIALAAQWDGDADTFMDALVELRLLDVEDDCVYSIHDWRDHNPYASGASQRSEKAKAAANARWGARDANTCNKQCSEHDGALPNASTRNAPSPSPAPLPKEKDIVHRPMHDRPSDFETFWQKYPARGLPPRRAGKEQARKAWVALARKGALPEIDALLASLHRDANSNQWRDPQYIPMASTWLRRMPWADAGENEERTQTGSLLDAINGEVVGYVD